ncbi:MFS transporter [Paenibacillus sp. y28]|uniref:MFS transporter n=1 Tax=Paenibacillus sp. y28 TaxID=3129110 RepID=UPI00301B0565
MKRESLETGDSGKRDVNRHRAGPLSIAERSTAYRGLLWSQSVLLFGTGLVFPFYLIFLRESGSSFTQFGLAYGLFTMSAALLHPLAGRLSDRWGSARVLFISAWGTALVFLLLPLLSSVSQLYAVQIVLGLLGALQKTAEKALLADITPSDHRGRRIGAYHGWGAVFSGLAVMAAGGLVDLFSIDFIFYVGSLAVFVSGCLLYRYRSVSSVSGGD